MKAILLMPVAVAITASAQAADFEWPVIDVLDGSTVMVDASADMPPELAEVLVRLKDADAPGSPDRGASCDAEEILAESAKTFTQSAIDDANTVVIRNPRWGERQNGVFAEIIIDGHPLSDLLIERQFGQKRKSEWEGSWC